MNSPGRNFTMQYLIASLVLSASLAVPALAADKPASIPVRGGTVGGGGGTANTVEKVEKFTPATKAESDAAIAEAKKDATVVADKMRVHFQTLETRHFLIFTNWDEREYGFLKENVENAYNAVSKQFEISNKDNIFVGKLPVYMFAKEKDFETFSKDFDGFDSSKLAGYYRGSDVGIGHMAMWKPDVAAANGDLRLAERVWAYVLVHEFTHAFVARYRTNAFVPRWLNEGLAEVIANHEFPKPGIYDYVRRMAGAGKGIVKMFDDKDLKSFTATDYPLAQTAVETLILGGENKAFLKYFNDIKDGMDPDEALEKYYHVDRRGLEEAWKKYVKTVR